MPEKIPRDVCLIKYRKLPLWEFDKKTEDEYSFYPKTYSNYSLGLKSKSNEHLITILSNQIVQLYELLKINELIFFSAHNIQWISKLTSDRDDSKDLINALEYFKKHKLSGKFNGAIKLESKEFNHFLKHFITLTQCDSGFYHNYFIDSAQKILGYIHYSGELQIDIIDDLLDNKFLEAIRKTDFFDLEK